jgi:hypothetical protein
MFGYSIPYYDLLIRLAMYQRDVKVPLWFKFQIVWGGDASTQNFRPEKPEIILVQPVTEEKEATDTLPLFNFPDLDPIQLWLSFGYIHLIRGSIEEGSGIFTLTEKSLGLDLIQSLGL